MLSTAACPQVQADSKVAADKPGNLKAAASKPAVEDKLGLKFTRNFNGGRAFADLEKQVAFGYRVPNTPGHRACRKWLEGELLKTCDTVERQDFSVPHGKGPLKMANIIGRYKANEPRRLILAAHWDTRPTSEYNPAGKRNLPIDGANDGASGVAVLLELARLLKKNPPPIGVDIVLFDGEDYGPGMDMMFLGAKHFAEKLSYNQVKSYNYGILLDMVGDKDLDIHAENHSHAVAPLIFETAYELNRALGYKSFRRDNPYDIYDDHLPLIARGIKMYDFIDFTYPYWHTSQDTVDKCSADSLEAVGRTVENMVYLYPKIYGE
jgi:glutaminyl-peptide cyclotransferase